MRHYRSEYSFEKYKPYESPWKKFLRFKERRKYKKITPIKQEGRYRENPYKIKKKELPLLSIKITMFIVFLVGWAALLLYIPYFRVNKISISGLNNLTKEEIDQFIADKYLKRSKIIPYSNYFLVDIDKIKNGLNKQFALDSIQMQKKFPNEINITIVEKISSLIYDNGQKYYLMDSGGTVIKYLGDVSSNEFINKTNTTPTTNTTNTNSSTDALLIPSFSTNTTTISSSTREHIPDYKKIQRQFGSYPILYDKRGLSLEEKETGVLSEQFISSVISWYKGLSGQGIETKYFILENMNSGVTIDTTDSWNILFKPENSADLQINNLKNLLKNIHPVNYVDLRFGDRVYWK